MNVNNSINAGLNLFLASSSEAYKNEILPRTKSDDNFKKLILDSAHRILYNYLHSSAMNGYTKNSEKLKNSISTWKISIIILDVFTGIIALSFLTLFVISITKRLQK